MCVRVYQSAWRRALFLTLTALHVFSNVRAVRALRLTSLNRERAETLLRHYFRTGARPAVHACGEPGGAHSPFPL